MAFSFQRTRATIDVVTSFTDLHDLTGKVAIVTGGSRGVSKRV
jgi:hypothetical protein